MSGVGFSVVIAVRNGATTIDRALTDVECQTAPPVEVIVVDDGSSDDTAEIVREHPSVRLIQREQLGAGSARNVGIAAASGEWVAFMDADDRWATSHLSELRRIVLAHPETVLVSTAHRRGHLGEAVDDPVEPGVIQRIDYFDHAARDIGVVWTSAAAAHRETALSVGGFGTVSHGEDLELWAKLALVGPVAVSDAVTALYTINPTGAMSSANIRRHPPECLADVSASMRVVVAALSDLSSTSTKSSLTAYAASRLAVAIRHAVVAGNEEMVCRLARLAPPHAPLALRALFSFARVAPEVLCGLQDARRRILRR